MSIILVRHGETPLNAARVIQPADTRLSERGIAQAAAMARRVATMGVAGIFSSDLPRALMTAVAIADASGCPVRTSALLQERNFGELRGRSYDSLGFDPLAIDDAPAGGESAEEFHQRVAQAFEAVLTWRAQLDGNLVVVTHGLVIRTMLEAHVDQSADAEQPAGLANCSLTIVEAIAPYRVSLRNCVRHLVGETLGDERTLSGF